jgi:8-oxo-dGTP pyrophosphatase MutT (NUDIX family)
MKPAACVLLPTYNTDAEILAISRKGDITQWGIPGGKQEKDESNLSCAQREIHEECCLLLDKTFLIPIYSGPCYGKDGRNFWVTTYLYEATTKFELCVPEEGYFLKPMELVDLCYTDTSPFAAYNIEVRKAWRSYKTAV